MKMKGVRSQVSGIHKGLIVGAVLCFGFAAYAVAEDVTIVARVASNLLANIDSVRPQGRVGADQTNSDTTFYLTVRTPADGDNTILFTQSALLSTDNAGSYTTDIDLFGIDPGVYDIGLKGHQHLTRVLQDVTLVDGGNVLNFSKADNSSGRGLVVLLAGDVNGAGTSPATLGDDVVNSVDLSTLIQNIDDTDATGNAERTNLNQDTVVNSVDISWMISNLDQTGDR